jgi:hypothetical protein
MRGAGTPLNYVGEMEARSTFHVCPSFQNRLPLPGVADPARLQTKGLKSASQPWRKSFPRLVLGIMRHVERAMHSRQPVTARKPVWTGFTCR